jgi:hypothetical protein
MNKPRRYQEERIHLNERIGERIIPDRPGRNEPRKKKRRPKIYGWMQKPRHAYFEHYRNPDPASKVLDKVA